MSWKGAYKSWCVWNGNQPSEAARILDCDLAATASCLLFCRLELGIYKIVVVNLNCSSLPVIDCCFNNFTRYMTLAASVFTTIVSEKFSSTSLLHTKYFPDFQGLIYGLSFTSTNDFSFIFLNYPLVWLHDILWSQGHGHVSLFHDGGRKFFGFK